jgi:3-methylfumaryl-CoA hydratase
MASSRFQDFLAIPIMDLNLDYLRQWRGKSESRSDRVTSAPIAALSATLDRDDPYPKPADFVPPLWHWLYFLPMDRQSELGADGHARRGGFLPPVPLPRRMFAGDRVQFHRPLRVGDTVTRLSRIVDVNAKQGRSGPLAFVTVRHEISDGHGLALVEEHDIVYRDRSKPSDSALPPQAAPPVVPEGAAWTREILPDPTLLFRYSALTFNGHRIHYDRRYATEVEGYPGLVVHGPLIATLLLDLLRRNLRDANVSSFSFRAMRPLFDTAPFSICGSLSADLKTARLWAKDSDGWLAMEATAELAK